MSAPSPLPSLHEMADRTRSLLDTIPVGAAPYVAVDGDVAAGAVTGTRTPPWTLGFWLGQLHLSQQVLGDPAIAARLRAENDRLCDLVVDRGREFDHDIGFLMILGPLAAECSGAPGRFTGPLEAACEALASRFNPRGGFLRAHGWQGSAGTAIDQPGDNDGPAGRFIADTWMNLPLLLWGAARFDRPQWAQVALAHARTARALLTTAEGWVLHGFEVDPETGEKRGPSTIQGVSPTSPWTRAQAWTAYGMELSAQLLGRLGLLAIEEALIWRREAQDLGVAAIAGSLPSGVSPWDLSMPQGERTPADTSASAILLAALVSWGRIADQDRIARLRAALVPYTEQDQAGTGLLGGGCYHWPAGLGIDEPCAWGDYFWMEASARSAGMPVPYDL